MRRTVTPRRPAETMAGRQLPEAAAAGSRSSSRGWRPRSGDRDLYIALGLVPRKLGKADLELSEADLEAAGAGAGAGWDPRGWSVDQAARILILLHAGGTGERFAARFGQLCRTADVGETIAFYRGLPLYPDPPRLEAQARARARAATCAPCSRRWRTATPIPPSSSTRTAGTTWC